jgi:hypothetical protein
MKTRLRTPSSSAVILVMRYSQIISTESAVGTPTNNPHLSKIAGPDWCTDQKMPTKNMLHAPQIKP